MPTDFLNKTCKERSETEKVNTTIEFLHFRNNPCTKFQLKMRILNFWTKLISQIFWNKFAQKKNPSGQKQQKMNITIESFIVELV